jgi:hypothetical protein
MEEYKVFYREENKHHEVDVPNAELALLLKTRSFLFVF